VVRGGAFDNNDQNVRCAVRNGNAPDNRNNNLGVRVVVLSTFFTRPVPAGSAGRRQLPGRGEKNGGVYSWPRRFSRPGE
jgi:hypothetical protein